MVYERIAQRFAKARCLGIIRCLLIDGNPAAYKAGAAAKHSFTRTRRSAADSLHRVRERAKNARWWPWRGNAPGLPIPFSCLAPVDDDVPFVVFFFSGARIPRLRQPAFARQLSCDSASSTRRRQRRRFRAPTRRFRSHSASAIVALLRRGHRGAVSSSSLIASSWVRARGRQAFVPSASPTLHIRLSAGHGERCPVVGARRRSLLPPPGNGVVDGEGVQPSNTFAALFYRPHCLRTVVRPFICERRLETPVCSVV